MLNKKSSITADITAAIRARHRRFDKKLIFNDSFAKELCGFPLEYLCNSLLFNSLLKKSFMPDIKGAESLVLYRANLIEKQVYRFINEGGGQYVIIAAGMDTFSMRYDQLNSKLNIIEIDHPNTQREKLKRINNKNIRISENVQFIASDLSNESIESALGRSTYDRNRKTFFSCAGLTYYLSLNNVLNLFDNISSIASPKSEIMFDYSSPNDKMTKNQLINRNKIRKLLKRSGEEIKSNFKNDELKKNMYEFGFSEIKTYSPDEIASIFFKEINLDMLRASPHNFIGHYKKLVEIIN